MPSWLLIGIPIVVAVLMWGILTLPDEDVTKEKDSDATDTPRKPSGAKKKK